MRTESVFSPRRTSQESNGPGTAPSEFWRKRSCSASPSSDVAAKPPTRSEWPPRYLVVECTTRSAPSSSGRCSAGDAKVLSTTRIAPAECAALAAAAMSTTFSSGLVGVSIQTRAVPSGSRPASPSLHSAAETYWKR